MRAKCFGQTRHSAYGYACLYGVFGSAHSRLPHAVWADEFYLLLRSGLAAYWGCSVVGIFVPDQHVRHRVTGRANLVGCRSVMRIFWRFPHRYDRLHVRCDSATAGQTVVTLPCLAAAAVAVDAPSPGLRSASPRRLDCTRNGTLTGELFLSSGPTRTIRPAAPAGKCQSGLWTK